MILKKFKDVPAFMKPTSPRNTYRYLFVASAAVVIAVLALLFMQYRSAERTQEYAEKTIKANLGLHLFALSEEAKRGILDHATHVIHSIGQVRFRKRDIPDIERAFTRASKRYPEIDDLFVVFFEAGQENETWRAFKFIPPDRNDPNVQTFEGSPVGRLVPDAAISDSLRQAWGSVEKEPQPALYTAHDPNVAESGSRQYFIHSIFAQDSLDRTGPLEAIGLVVFSAVPEKFPSADYFQRLVLKHQNQAREGKFRFTFNTSPGLGEHALPSPGDTSPKLTRRFADSDKLFPNLTFGISAQDIDSNFLHNEYRESSVFLGLVAALAAILALAFTWRATRREMQLAQMKSDFLANISHELKTPLTAIRAFGDLLHSGRANKPERIREYGGMIKTESDRLTSLISNILEMSRLERGIRKYRLETGDLRNTVEETVKIFKHSPDAAACDIKLALSHQPFRTKFDEGAIRQALINLLSNAVRYSGGDSHPRIVVGLRRDAEDAVIEVRDFGIGVSNDDQNNIFEPFNRSTNDDIQAKGGTGLGLAIVREVARGHGGDVSVESKLGEGSVFRLRLPIPDEVKEEVVEVENGAYLGYRRRA